MSNKKFMQRALDIAALGLGRVSPNPMVGCVIVHKNEIIGEGWHRQFGGAHAEVMAVDAVENKGLIKESTIYVTLEPCSYYGKTPACTDLLIKVNPAKVVVASLDPNPKVSGTGVELLKSAGIEVEVGVLEEAAIALNKRFFVSMNLGRPYIILKWAITSDGYMARTDYDSKWISNSLSRQRVHKWRAEEDGILVGYNTVVHDNPELTVRDWQGRNPVRIVLDPSMQLDATCKVFNDAARTYWLNTKKDFETGTVIGKSFPARHELIDGLRFLNEENIGSLIIEGGAATLNKFIDAGLWDEARTFVAPSRFEDGIKGPILEYPVFEEQNIAEDRLLIVYNPKTKQLWQKN